MNRGYETVPARGTAPVSRFTLVLGIIIIFAVGYVAGTRSNQIMAAISSVFGIPTYTGTLDTATLQEVYRQLKANYDGDLDDTKLLEGAKQGMAAAVGDQYTQYLGGSDAEEFRDSLSGTVGGGIGAEIGVRRDQPTIIRILEGNPAEAAGLKAGDVIVSVNGESVEGATADVAASKVRGESGTTVVVVINRDGKEQEFTITRAEVSNPSVTSRIVDGVGVVTLYRFDDETAELARKAAENFKEKGVKGVVLDLRNNGGGYLDAAVGVSSVWLNDKLVVEEKVRGITSESLRSSKNPVLEGVPTVVLVNEFSASASEIVAGALKDNDAATLIGETTYGKGTVQRVIDISNGGLLRVTIARWFSPSGVEINGKGIVPNQKVGLTSSDLDKGNDPQFDAALKHLVK